MTGDSDNTSGVDAEVLQKKTQFETSKRGIDTKPKNEGWWINKETLDSKSTTKPVKLIPAKVVETKQTMLSAMKASANSGGDAINDDIMANFMDKIGNSD